MPPDRIVTLDSRISGAHTLPHKNLSATAPDHIYTSYNCKAKWCDFSFQSI